VLICYSGNFKIYIDFDGRLGDSNVDKLIAEVRSQCKSNMLVLDQKEVPWFPRYSFLGLVILESTSHHVIVAARCVPVRHISDLDLIANRTLDAGADLESDHPGFNDATYRSQLLSIKPSVEMGLWLIAVVNVAVTAERAGRSWHPSHTATRWASPSRTSTTPKSRRTPGTYSHSFKCVLFNGLLT
jgi:hypothetical protein